MLPRQEKHMNDVHTHHVDQYHNHLRLFKKHNSLKNMSSNSSDFHTIMALHHLQQASSHKKAFTRLGNIMHREFKK